MTSACPDQRLSRRVRTTEKCFLRTPARLKQIKFKGTAIFRVDFIAHRVDN